MPTLLEKGKIVKQSWMSRETKRAIDNMTGAEFLMQYIGDRLWAARDIPPKEKMKGIGSRVIVLRSGTGSGKSTILPADLYKNYLTQGGNLIIAEPTKSITAEVPYDIAAWNEFAVMGETIGYQTGSAVWKPKRGILFCTIGIMLQFLKTMTPEEFMKRYKFIIIDEVHVRSTEVDSTLYYLKRMLEKHWDTPECPLVILTSATFDPTIFMEYLHVPRQNFLDVLGATYPREVNFCSFDVSNFQQYIIDLVEKIHVENVSDIIENNIFRDILIFVSGSKQIKEISDAVHELNSRVFSRGLSFAQKHSADQWSKWKHGGGDPCYYLAPVAVMSANIQRGGKDYQDLFSPIETVVVPIYEFNDAQRTDKIIKYVSAARRVMIGTNSVEAGVTLNTLKYCIDSGWVNESSFNPNFGCAVLVNKNVTQANVEQRKGRIGRKAPGKFYAVYTEESFKAMPELPYPEIVKADITQFLLDTIISETQAEIIQVTAEEKSAAAFQMNQFDQHWYELSVKKIFRASTLDLLQYPSSDSIQYAIEQLHGLGLITDAYQPTIFGMYASKFRKLPIQAIRMILAGYHTQSNILDLVTIACCLQESTTLINKKTYQPRDPLGVGDADASAYFKLLFADEFIEFLFIWDDFMKAVENLGTSMEKSARTTNVAKIAPRYLEKWASDNAVSLEALLRVVELRDEVVGDMLSMGLNPYYNGLDLPRGTYNLVKILKRNLSEGMAEVQKIKKAIYEGYRFNLCIWNSISKCYVNHHRHNDIVIDSAIVKPLFKESQADRNVLQISPQKIIVNCVMVRPSFKNKGMFEFVGDYISVMDGFIDVDLGFLNA